MSAIPHKRQPFVVLPLVTDMDGHERHHTMWQVAQEEGMSGWIRRLKYRQTASAAMAMHMLSDLERTYHKEVYRPPLHRRRQRHPFGVQSILMGLWMLMTLSVCAWMCLKRKMA